MKYESYSPIVFCLTGDEHLLHTNMTYNIPVGNSIKKSNSLFVWEKVFIASYTNHSIPACFQAYHIHHISVQATIYDCRV